MALDLPIAWVKRCVPPAPLRDVNDDEDDGGGQYLG